MKIRTSLLAGTLTMLGMALCPPAATASLIQLYSGNTVPDGTGKVDGVVNFGVFDRTGGSAGCDSFGLGQSCIDGVLTAGGLSTTAAYLYVFQTVNIQGDTTAITKDEVVANSITSYGVIRGYGWDFHDSDGYVGRLNNFGTPCTPGDVATACTGVTLSGPPIQSLGTLKQASLSLGVGTLIATWSPGLVQGEDGSELWGYTSDLGPGSFGLTTIYGGVTSSQGSVPVGGTGFQETATVPEPATLTLLGFGLIAGARKLRARQQSR